MILLKRDLTKQYILKESQMASARATKRFMKLAFTPLAIFSLVLVVPFATGFYYTFTDWDGFEDGIGRMVSLGYLEVEENNF